MDYTNEFKRHFTCPFCLLSNMSLILNSKNASPTAILWVIWRLKSLVLFGRYHKTHKSLEKLWKITKDHKIHFIKDAWSCCKSGGVPGYRVCLEMFSFTFDKCSWSLGKCSVWWLKSLNARSQAWIKSGTCKAPVFSVYSVSSSFAQLHTYTATFPEYPFWIANSLTCQQSAWVTSA